MVKPRRVLSLCVMLGLVSAMAVSVPARADDGNGAESRRWRDMADQVFHPVARDIDLPNVLIPESLVQDGQGFIWIGEETGLLRWDGYRFHSYAYDPSEPDGLRDDFIQTLHSDARGRLWIGTVAGGLARFDEARGRPVSVPLDVENKGTAQRIWAIDDDGAGGIWVASSSGLYHLDANGRVVGHLQHKEGQAGSLPGDVVPAMLRDRTGNLWIGTGSGLYRRDAGGTAFHPVGVPVAGGLKVLHLFQDGAGRIWIGTRQHGAFVVQPGEDFSRAVPMTAPSGQDTASPEITSITEITPGTIWLGTYGRGILEVDGDTLRTRRIRHDPLVPSSLDSDTVRSLFRDRSGIIWVGTNQGLSQHTPGSGGILTVFGAAGRANSLTDGDVGAIMLRRDGTLWIGTEGGGLDVFDATGTRIGVLPVGRVFCLAESPAGGVLVGTNNGLFLAEDTGKRIAKLSIPGRGASTGVFALRVIDGAVWLGGLEDGLWQFRVDASGGVAVQRHVIPGGLANANVRAIEKLKDNRLAIGTDDGMDLLDLGTGVLEHVGPDPADPSALAAYHVMAFLVDRKGRLWAGTDSAGISVLEGRDASGRLRFRHLTVADGLPNENVDRMLLDRQGRIWASTDNGFAVIDPDSFAVRPLRRADGVAVAAYWNGSGTATPAGNLLFGGLGGMTVVQPDLIRLWDYRPAVVVTNVRVGGREVPWHPPAAPATAKADTWLTVAPTANSLAVEFSALDFSAPSLNRYAYRLAGFDQDWVPTDAAHREADYTNLPPGDYTLWLRGSNRNGVWSDQQPELHIRVLPAWYQTTAFRATAVAAAIVAVLCLVQARTILLRRRQRELERQVADRTAELIASQQQLHHFAFFDVLTGLPNRRAFNDQFRTMIADAARTGAQFALLLIDLDGFKQVNDSLGHDAGDDLLVIAAARMRECLAGRGFAARLGGDEFAILLGDIADPVPVEQMCETVVAKLAQTASIGHSTVTAGASVGVALFPDHGQDSEELLRHVDLALYDAKRSGRGTWRWYRDSQQPAFAFGEKGPLPRRMTGSRQGV